MKTAEGTEKRVFCAFTQRNVLVGGFLNLLQVCQQRTEAIAVFFKPNLNSSVILAEALTELIGPHINKDI